MISLSVNCRTLIGFPELNRTHWLIYKTHIPSAAQNGSRSRTFQRSVGKLLKMQITAIFCFYPKSAEKICAIRCKKCNNPRILVAFFCKNVDLIRFKHKNTALRPKDTTLYKKLFPPNCPLLVLQTILDSKIIKNQPFVTKIT